MAVVGRPRPSARKAQRAEGPARGRPSALGPGLLTRAVVGSPRPSARGRETTAQRGGRETTAQRAAQGDHGPARRKVQRAGASHAGDDIASVSSTARVSAGDRSSDTGAGAFSRATAQNFNSGCHQIGPVALIVRSLTPFSAV